MRFKVEVIVADRGSRDELTHAKAFDNREDAELYKQGILSGMKPNEYTEWAKIIPVVNCSCGEEIECTSFTNTCDCGNDYNFAGQLLAPREQWGEETGEDWHDCY